ncbi:MAG: DUF721 domain-containing protein [Desulfuromonadales bacterium]|nr:MAG: DUF721 domain-containing protein [Desulfuromonadales bacterium]
MSRPRTVGDLLAAAFKGKPAEKCLKEGRIWLLWDGTVGAQIASQAQPVRFRDGTLTVAVFSAPWMQQLNFLKARIVEQLNRQLGECLIKEIYLKAGTPPPKVTATTTKPKEARPLTENEEAWVAKLSGTVSDPDLRGTLAGLLARHLSDNDPSDGHSAD